MHTQLAHQIVCGHTLKSIKHIYENFQTGKKAFSIDNDVADSNGDGDGNESESRCLVQMHELKSKLSNIKRICAKAAFKLNGIHSDFII